MSTLHGNRNGIGKSSVTFGRGTAVALWCILTVLGTVGVAIASIRLDGTQFQGASAVSATAEKSGNQATALKLVWTMGQAVMAQGCLPVTETGTAVCIGLGYDYNVEGTTLFGCNCPTQGQFGASKSRDAVAIASLIDIVFFGVPDIQDPACPQTRADFDCSGAADSVDLSLLIDHVFFGGWSPINPCYAR